LNQKSIIIGIISNFDERLFNILKNLNLDKHFNFIVIPSMCNGYAKPSKQIFDQAFHLSNSIRPNLKINRDEILHVGDDVHLDYEAARNSNFKSLLFNPNNNKMETIQKRGHTFNHLNEIENKINNL
jgi:putative hydrolase of the HAD superfamily